MQGHDYLAEIVARKRVEIRRRRRHRIASRAQRDGTVSGGEGRPDLVRALRRDDAAAPHVVAEVKFRSPSAGVIRRRDPGATVDIAREYVQAGASVVSVLADGAGFGGTPLDVRRVASAIHKPVLFKEFVIDEVQVTLARAMGASLVLLLVRLLDDETLGDLVATVRARGMEPVVEAAGEHELERALGSEASIVGVNARDLATFRVDGDAARRCLARTPADRVAVLMSGITSPGDFGRAASGRADALLVGEALMRDPDPGSRLSSWLASVR